MNNRLDFIIDFFPTDDSELLLIKREECDMSATLVTPLRHLISLAASAAMSAAATAMASVTPAAARINGGISVVDSLLHGNKRTIAAASVSKNQFINMDSTFGVIYVLSTSAVTSPPRSSGSVLSFSLARERNDTPKKSSHRLLPSIFFLRYDYLTDRSTQSSQNFSRRIDRQQRSSGSPDRSLY